MNKGDCLKKKGHFFSGKTEAAKYCRDHQPCWCCRDGRVVKTVRGECRKSGGRAFKDKKAAVNWCDLHQHGWCCLDGKITKTLKIDCLKKKGKYFSTRLGAKRFLRSVVGKKKGHAKAKVMMAKAPAGKIMKSHKKPGSSTSSPATAINMNASQFVPAVKIDYFKKKIALPSGRPGYVSFLGPGGGGAPDSATIKPGESITLKWAIKACNEDYVLVYINDSNVTSGLQHHTTQDGCTYWKGEGTYTPYNTTTYRLKAVGSPHTVTRWKDFTVNVPRPNIDILRPTVNQDNLNVTVSVRNRGDADVESAQLRVNYAVSRGGSRIATGNFVTSPITIRHRGRKVDLGSFSLESHRSELLAHPTARIWIRVSSTSEGIDVNKEFVHTWRPKTFAINSTLVSLLNSLSGYDIRLNNYGGGVHPHVANDCHFSLTVMGSEASSGNFNIDPYVERILIAIPPSPVPIKQAVAIYINHILSSQTGASDFLSIRGGKLVVHLNFPNSGNREIKTGFHNWGRHDEFRDNPVADVELGPFSVDVLLTPQLRGGRVSYGAVEVETHDISASLVGAMDDALNSSGMVRRFLNRKINNIIVRYLTILVDSDGMRTAFENGIADNLPRDITRITDLTASGDTITIEYF